MPGLINSFLIKSGFLFLILFLFSSKNTNSQIYKQGDFGYITNSTIIDGDTIAFIILREVTIYPPRVFKNSTEEKKYWRLVYNIKKAYPYSKLAKKMLYAIARGMDSLKTEREKKVYVKLQEDLLKKRFEGELKKLTITQGRILIKLIDRETGASSYNLVKELRGTFSAFMWQAVARMFGSNLKDKYDSTGDDKIIEEIIVKIENGQY